MAEEVAGFYGKLPHLGDFVSRRLTRQFVEPWDRWLQSSIAASREQLGEQWLEHYLVCPIWRFALSPGVCGDQAMAGVVMPSVDRVGRYFPLTIACSVAPIAIGHLFLPHSKWFEQLEQLALTGLQDGFDFERFDQDVSSLCLPLAATAGLVRETEVVGGGNVRRRAYQWSVHDLSMMDVVFADFSRLLMETTAATYSWWGTAGADRFGPSFLACEGLPPVDAFTALLMGNWSQRSWTIRSYSVAYEAGEDTVPVDLGSNGGGAGDLTKTANCHWVAMGISIVGNKRKINEDALLDRTGEGMWAVADGMGGHTAGDVASQAIVEALNAVPAVDDLNRFVEGAYKALQETNLRLWRLGLSSDDGNIIGSTVVALLARGNHCRFVWAGDSRLYCFRHGTLDQLTRDHSLLDELASQNLGGMDTTTEHSARVNVITRAVGADATLALDDGETFAQVGDIFVLCSDGLDKELTSSEIEQICELGNPNLIARELIARSEASGARDNVTVLVAKYQPEASREIG